jgi:hypothetical protein
MEMMLSITFRGLEEDGISKLGTTDNRVPVTRDDLAASPELHMQTQGEVPVLAVDLVEFDVRLTKDATSPLPRVVDEGPETMVFHDHVIFLKHESGFGR